MPEACGGLDVTAIVVSYNSALVLPACLEAMRSANVDVLVVDNASSDASVAVARSYGARVLPQARNLGYGRANSLGVAAAEGRAWCLILNPDVVIGRDALAGLVAAAEEDPKAALVAPRIVEADGRVFEHETSVLSPVAPPLPDAGACGEIGLREVAFTSGAAMLVRRAAFEDIGGFDPNIFLFYEDDDLCLRLRRTGWQILQVDRVSVEHGRGKSSAPGKGAGYVSRYHQAWSRVYVLRKYGMATGAIRFLMVNALKLVGATLVLNRQRMERYRGSVAGTLAALRGEAAFANEDEA